MAQATITIDDQQYEVQEGANLLETALRLGNEIPHFCWHPGLSIDGNCRMCQVEVEGERKLAISCNTKIRDGMVVQVNSPTAIKAREAVLEFLLINHPLDCPICDEAGECPLQDFAYLHGTGHSRFDFPKRKLRKHVDIGPHVVLDEERCILCRRCVRFCEEVVGVKELAVFNRADGSVLRTYPGRRLENRYSGNTVDICPVGALTLKEFRFQARVWDMENTPSVCPGCANGCNIYLGTKNEKILRILPRVNEEVNGHWICDDGRLSYPYVNSPDRLVQPLIRRDGVLEPNTWGDALSHVADRLRAVAESEGPEAIGAIGSPHCTNEENYLLRCLFGEVIGTPHLDLLAHTFPGDCDDFLIKEDKAANTRGGREVGMVPSEGGLDAAGMVEAAREGRLKALYIMAEQLTSRLGEEVLDALESLDLLVVQELFLTPVAERATVVLPAASYAEKDGTFTNHAGIVQRIRPAIASPPEARPDWRILVDLWRALEGSSPFAHPRQVAQALAREIEGYEGIVDLYREDAPILRRRLRPAQLYQAQWNEEREFRRPAGGTPTRDMVSPAMTYRY